MVNGFDNELDDGDNNNIDIRIKIEIDVLSK